MEKEKRFPQWKNKIFAGSVMPEDKNIVFWYIGAAALQLFMIVLRFLPFGKYSVAVSELSLNSNGIRSLNKIIGFPPETALFVIITAFSAGLCILPIINKTLGKKRRLIFTKSLGFYNALMIVLGTVTLEDCVAQNRKIITKSFGAKYFSGNWSLTFCGWLSALVTVALITVCFVISQKTKHYKK